MNIPTAICCKCLVAMRCAKNSVLVEMIATNGYGRPLSYYKISGDRWQCPNCGIEVLSGFAMKPLAEYWQRGYQKWKADVQARFE